MRNLKLAILTMRLRLDFVFVQLEMAFWVSCFLIEYETGGKCRNSLFTDSSLFAKDLQIVCFQMTFRLGDEK